MNRKALSDPIRLRDDIAAFPYLAPFLLVFSVFIAYPLFYSLWISLHRGTIFTDYYDTFGSMKWVGAGNYLDLFANPIFWWSIALTLIYSLITIIPGIALSLGLALWLNRKGRCAGAMRAGFFLPNVYDLYVVGVIWLLLYNPNGGIIAKVIAWLGADSIAQKGVLNIPWLTLPAIALAMILKNAGFGMILFLTSLNTINKSIFEAADVDGANARQKLFLVTIPLLRPIILFLTIMGIVGSLNAFSEIYAMTDDSGGPSLQILGRTLQSARISGYHLYKVFNDSMYGEAAAISFILLAIALVISYFNFRFLTPRD